MSKILVDTIDTRSGTSNITIGSSNASQITLKSGATLTNFPQMTPMFSAYMNASTQSISHATLTTIVFDAENYDTDNCFSTSTYRFTPTVAGKYFLFANTRLNVGTDLNNNFELEIRHSAYNSRVRGTGKSSANTTWNVATILDFNGIDEYARCTFYQDSGSSKSLDNGNGDTLFGGYKIIGA